MAAGAVARRLAEPQRGNRPLNGIQSVQPRALQQPIAAEAVEQFGREVLQMRTAVEQKQLADHHRKQRVIVAPELIAPPAEHGADPGDLAVHAIASEDPPRQGQPLEAAHQVKLVEAAQQIGVRREVGADLVASPAGRTAAELRLVTAE